MNTITTPIIPMKLAPSIKSILYHLMPFIISGSVNNSAERAVIAITIIIMGDTIPALTAASPNIKAPTVDKALEVKDGLLRSHSLNISNANAISIASKKAGKGTLDRWEAKLTKSSVGNISWLKVVTAKYIAGVNKVIKKARYLTILVKVIFMLLLKLSSVDINKSFKKIGSISAN